MNKYEELILKVLEVSVRDLNIKEISKYSKIDWSTAKKYLNILYNKNMVKKIKKGRINYWRFVYETK